MVVQKFQVARRTLLRISVPDFFWVSVGQLTFRCCPHCVSCFCYLGLVFFYCEWIGHWVFASPTWAVDAVGAARAAGAEGQTESRQAVESAAGPADPWALASSSLVDAWCYLLNLEKKERIIWINLFSLRNDSEIEQNTIIVANAEICIIT